MKKLLFLFCCIVTSLTAQELVDASKELLQELEALKPIIIEQGAADFKILQEGFMRFTEGYNLLLHKYKLHPSENIKKALQDMGNHMDKIRLSCQQLGTIVIVKHLCNNFSGFRGENLPTPTEMQQLIQAQYQDVIKQLTAALQLSQETVSSLQSPGIATKYKIIGGIVIGAITLIVISASVYTLYRYFWPEANLTKKQEVGNALMKDVQEQIAALNGNQEQLKNNIENNLKKFEGFQTAISSLVQTQEKQIGALRAATALENQHNCIKDELARLNKSLAELNKDYIANDKVFANEMLKKYKKLQDDLQKLTDRVIFGEQCILAGSKKLKTLGVNFNFQTENTKDTVNQMCKILIENKYDMRQLFFILKTLREAGRIKVKSPVVNRMLDTGGMLPKAIDFPREKLKEIEKQKNDTAKSSNPSNV